VNTPARPAPGQASQPHTPHHEHTARIPAGTLYYRTQGTGPLLVLIGGGPSNADTLGALAGFLAGRHTVVTYDRRGYSRSRLDDPDGPAGMADHGDDVRRLIGELDLGPASVFGTSIGALIALALAAADPAAVDTLVVHEPPLGQLLTDAERPAFDLEPGDSTDAGTALNAIAASIGVKRGLAAGDPAARPGIQAADVELFIRRDAPAVGDFQLDLDQLKPLSGRVIVTGSKDGRDFYPYKCAACLADRLGTPLAELPGNHAGMIQHPEPFAQALEALLPH
jgi:pimeloyl-ACP methyl ester carboxylesterase